MMKNIKEIKDMWEKGITLSSGVKLSLQDVHEIIQISRINWGMSSYEYVKENIEDVDENGNDIVWPDVEAHDADFYESIYYALQERCKLAFKDVHTKSGRQHASEEQVTLADRYVTLTANQYCYKRRPIEPDDRIEEVECQATQVDTQARRSLHIAEVYLVCLACLGSVAGFKEHRIKTETGHNACANVYNPTIVEQQDHLLHRYVS